MIANRVKQNVNQRVEETDWLPLGLESVAAVVIGILLLVSPKNASVLIITLLALFFLISGISSVISIFRDRHNWGWRLGFGLLSIVVSAVIITHRLQATYLSAAALLWLSAAAGFVYGLVLIVRGFTGAGYGRAVLGVLCLLLSFLLVIKAPSASLLVPWLVGIAAIIAGAFGIWTAIQKWAHRPGRRAS